MRRLVLYLAILAPVLLVAAYVIYFPLTIALEQVSRAHLADEIGSATLVMPLLALASAWLLGLADTARRGLWGWFALVLLVPLLGAVLYGAAGPREGKDAAYTFTSIAAVVLGMLAVMSLLASVVLPRAGLSAQPEADQRLLDIFGLGFAAAAGAASLIASLRRGQRAVSALLGILIILALAQLVLGASYPTDHQLPEGDVPGLTQSCFGFAVAASIGYLTTAALAAALALGALAIAFRAERSRGEMVC